MTTVEFIEKIRDERGGRITVGLFGLGRGNLCLLELLRKVDGCALSVRSDSPVSMKLGDIPVLCGKDAEKIYEDVLILSPSVRRDRSCFIRASESGSIITSECDIFFTEDIGKRFLVSGSDGKSTTTTLAARMLEGAFSKVYPLGNIGIPYSTVPLNSDACYVCELSSFNLEYIEPASERCVLTNITENHLDWHGSLDNYIRAKMRMLVNTRAAVLPAKIAELAMERGIAPDTVYSVDMPLVELKARYDAQHYVYVEDGWICADGEQKAPLSLINSSVPFSLENGIAAVALTLGYAKAERVREVLRSFTGLSHRCQVCQKFGGVEYIDSSIDTSPARTAATLEALRRRVMIILGGRGKGLSFEPLKLPLQKFAKHIALYGELGQELLKWIEQDEELCLIPHATFEKMADAVIHLVTSAGCGDVVLLSPGGTSYGEFSDYEERGRAFSDTVATFLNKKQ